MDLRRAFKEVRKAERKSVLRSPHAEAERTIGMMNIIRKWVLKKRQEALAYVVFLQGGKAVNDDARVKLIKFK